MVDRRFVTGIALVLALGLAGSACRGGGSDAPSLPAPGSMDADRFLYGRGTELLQKKNWITAREYFRRLIDSYPQSPLRHDARLGVGDAYFGENRTESYILGINEFRQFLQFAPLNPRADYAQYRICYGQSRMMLNAQRDQTATRDALTDCDAFLRAYPNSPLRPEVEAIRRRVRDRLSDYEFNVGKTYYQQRIYGAAHDRFVPLLTEDPGYSRLDEVIFHIGEVWYKAKQNNLALPFYERLIAEYPKSKYFKKAQDRVKEVKR